MGVEHIVPKARIEDLVIKELGDEVLVYDLKRHQAHCLNKAAALVWRHCDGRKSVADLAQIVGRGLHVTVDEETIWYSLDQLGKSHLLEENATLALPLHMDRMKRRDFMKKAGVAAAVTIPLVASLAVPTAAHAVTCTGTCAGGCSTGCQCGANNTCVPI